MCVNYKNFWTIDSPNSGSWIWKQLCKLGPLTRRFVSCQLGSVYGMTTGLDLAPVLNLLDQLVRGTRVWTLTQRLQRG